MRLKLTTKELALLSEEKLEENHALAKVRAANERHKQARRIWHSIAREYEEEDAKRKHAKRLDREVSSSTLPVPA